MHFLCVWQGSQMSEAEDGVKQRMETGKLGEQDRSG